MDLKRYTYIHDDLLSGGSTETTELEPDMGDPTSVEEMFSDFLGQQSNAYKAVSASTKWDGDFMVSAELKMRTHEGRTVLVTFGA